MALLSGGHAGPPLQEKTTRCIMKSIDTRLVIAGILFLLTVVSGMWLTRSGRPLNTLIFTAHKLIAVAVVVLMIVVFIDTGKGAAMSPAIIVSLVFTALFFIGLFATGAVLSIEKTPVEIIRKIHALLPLLTAALAVLSVYLLLNKA
jgi:hypothetical protein